jgi:bifunctional DNA-binding transcriptional regulator/antitoxin component of YhaV-PrlF toxin-antitoxin module
MAKAHGRLPGRARRVQARKGGYWIALPKELCEDLGWLPPTVLVFKRVGERVELSMVQQAGALPAMRGKLGAGMQFLEDSVPALAQDLIQRAEELGISRPTVYRARAKLGLTSDRDNLGRVWWRRA